MQCVNCKNEARPFSLFCEECAVTTSPAYEAELEKRFGVARPCTKCGERFRTKDLKIYQCPGCRRFS